LSAIEAGMSGLATLVKLAERRADEAVAAWQRLNAQCDDAKHKLVLLQQHREAYRELTHTGLQHGMPAGSIVAHVGFIGQIETVVVRQTNEIGQLEAACVRQWQAVVDSRRDKRRYEILTERAAARDAATASQRTRMETEEALSRAAAVSEPVFAADLTNNGNFANDRVE
jgi:flagellar export protein FliJ